MSGSNAPEQSGYALPGYDDRASMSNSLAWQATGQQNDFRNDQRQLAGQLQSFASGQQSVSMAQLAQARDSNIRAQMALAAASRPGQGALGARMAAQQMGDINQRMAQQAVAEGLRERMSAQQTLAGVLQGARQQDINREGAYRDLNLSNARAQQQGMMGFQGARAQQPDAGDQILAMGQYAPMFLGQQKGQQPEGAGQIAGLIGGAGLQGVQNGQQNQARMDGLPLTNPFPGGARYPY
jgi:hypothetical protein